MVRVRDVHRRANSKCADRIVLIGTDAIFESQTHAYGSVPTLVVGRSRSARPRHGAAGVGEQGMDAPYRTEKTDDLNLQRRHLRSEQADTTWLERVM